MGLSTVTICGVGIIDAHAGALALVGASLPHNPPSSSLSTHPIAATSSTAVELKASGTEDEADLSGRMALIFGSSTCHMLITKHASFVPGVWGPYFSACIPQYHLLEGGQSATGTLLDSVIDSHAHGASFRAQAAAEKCPIHTILTRELSALATEARLDSIHLLTRDIHCLPYFHGNRSPRADPSLTGILTGLTLDTSARSLLLHYLAAIQAIAYGTRHILDTIESNGVSVKTLFACGGLSHHSLFVQTHADATQRCIILGRESESMLLGAGMIAAAACGIYPTLNEAMKRMTAVEKVVPPSTKLVQFHDNKYRVFLLMYEHQMQYRELMARSSSLDLLPKP